ncbi:SDR family oxidoreductase [Geitlerinema sp. P-1104]|uniref:SDR family oxidoreductase n=1 Tax=Geitlerinema sp. P-1104 TaxID=2546230 RepID=UPI0014771D2C|nr:SDR family oxidoreductase [Geitlerinema sp. P-1104]NMG57124.1 SDR family oxidoreductase [Geitlerinema sp. P-1104]
MTSNSAKTIVLTGVSRGLGQAMLEGFIAQGHRLFGCATDEGAIAQLQNTYNAPHHFSVVDLADERQVQRWSQQVLQEIPAPDILINNAGVINEPARVWEISAPEFDRIIDVNIKGVANVLRHFIPAMIDSQGGIIVNFSSTWGRSTSPEVAPYCATKWAIEGLTRSLSQELPSHLAAVALNPGVINTDMLQTCFGSSANNYTTPTAWARSAVPFILGLTSQDNGKAATVPG